MYEKNVYRSIITGFDCLPTVVIMMQFILLQQQSWNCTFSWLLLVIVQILDDWGYIRISRVPWCSGLCCKLL